MHNVFAPLAAAQATADPAAPRQLANGSSDIAAAADLPPELRGQRHAVLTVRAVLAAAAAADAVAGQDTAGCIADALAAEAAAAAAWQAVPALTAHLRAALAALPRHSTPSRQYSMSPQHQQQRYHPGSPFGRQQRQRSGGSPHSSFGRAAASPPALVRFGDFDPGVPEADMELDDDMSGAVYCLLPTAWL